MEFSEQLGIGNTALSKIETGENPVTEQNIRLICLTFGVREEWLRTGNGEMFGKETLPGFEELLNICKNLYPENQKLILNIARDILETQRSLLGTDHPKI